MLLYLYRCFANKNKLLTEKKRMKITWTKRHGGRDYQTWKKSFHSATVLSEFCNYACEAKSLSHLEFSKVAGLDYAADIHKPSWVIVHFWLHDWKSLQIVEKAPKRGSPNEGTRQADGISNFNIALWLNICRVLREAIWMFSRANWK